MSELKMAATNPWARDDPRSRRYPVALGGIKAFVTRNQLASDEHSTSDEARRSSSSQELMARIRSATQRTESLFNDVRKLEQLEMAAATAQCTEPHQLQLRIARVRSLRDQLAAVLDVKPVLLQMLRKNAATEFLDVEMEHQRTFVDVFCKLAHELPQFVHVVRTLEGMEALATDVDDSRREYERTVAELKATVAKYQDAFDDMEKLRSAYSRLQTAQGTQ